MPVLGHSSKRTRNTELCAYHDLVFESVGSRVAVETKQTTTTPAS